MLNQDYSQLFSNEAFDWTTLPAPIHPADAKTIMKECTLIPYPPRGPHQMITPFHKEWERVLGDPRNRAEICCTCWQVFPRSGSSSHLLHVQNNCLFMKKRYFKKPHEYFQILTECGLFKTKDKSVQVDGKQVIKRDWYIPMLFDAGAPNPIKNLRKSEENIHQTPLQISQSYAIDQTSILDQKMAEIESLQETIQKEHFIAQGRLFGRQRIRQKKLSENHQKVQEQMQDIFAEASKEIDDLLDREKNRLDSVRRMKHRKIDMLLEAANASRDRNFLREQVLCYARFCGEKSQLYAKLNEKNKKKIEAIFQHFQTEMAKAGEVESLRSLFEKYQSYFNEIVELSPQEVSNLNFLSEYDLNDIFSQTEVKEKSNNSPISIE